MSSSPISTICSPRPSWRFSWGSRTLGAGALALLLGCRAPVTTYEPIFLAGRAVAPAGDSFFAVTSRQAGAVLRYDRLGRLVDTLGAGVLRNPDHLQAVGDTWFVSDLRVGRPVVVVVGPDGAVARTVDLGDVAAHAHQFAILPDGAIVVETKDGRLVALRGDSAATFAAVEIGPRPSLLLGAGGGVLHAVPDRHITLYNGFGNIRWRIEWPWASTAYISDVGQDSRGRIHAIAGVEASNTFIAYTFEEGTGEIIRWSEETREGSFLVDRLGEIVPAEGRWSGN
jgi:hypothetical protein